MQSIVKRALHGKDRLLKCMFRTRVNGRLFAVPAQRSSAWLNHLTRHIRILLHTALARGLFTDVGLGEWSRAVAMFLVDDQQCSGHECTAFQGETKLQCPPLTSRAG